MGIIYVDLFVCKHSDEGVNEIYVRFVTVKGDIYIIGAFFMNRKKFDVVTKNLSVWFVVYCVFLGIMNL